jgi:hypothetical protein
VSTGRLRLKARGGRETMASSSARSGESSGGVVAGLVSRWTYGQGVSGEPHLEVRLGRVGRKILPCADLPRRPDVVPQSSCKSVVAARASPANHQTRDIA